jgi:phosphate transport system permease protein
MPFKGDTMTGSIIVLIIVIVGLLIAVIRSLWNPYRKLETILVTLFAEISCFALLLTLGIIFFLTQDSIRFFKLVPAWDFFFGIDWKPSLNLYGMIPLLLGTLLITTIGAIIAVPIGLFIAIYTAFYAPAHSRYILKPLVELLAGIPSIVYGFFALVTVAPAVHLFGEKLGIDISTESALAVGLVMGVMMLPYMASLSDDALVSIPKELKENSYAMGATIAETIKRVALPAAFPGLVTAFLLAVSRAIGETMLVVMAAGVTARMTINPLQSVTTITVQIVSLLTGDQEFDRAETLSAFALGLTLFILTFLINLVALFYSYKYRRKYG